MNGTFIIPGGSAIPARILVGRVHANPRRIRAAAGAAGVFGLTVDGEFYVSVAGVEVIEQALRRRHAGRPLVPVMAGGAR